MQDLEPDPGMTERDLITV